MRTLKMPPLVNSFAFTRPGEQSLHSCFLGVNYLPSSLMFFDDLTRTDASMVREFHTRFACAKPQMHPLLDLLADILRDSYNHFLPSCANLVLSSSLDFLTGLVVDHDLQNMQVHFFVSNL
jgi:hypothetical protein